MLELALAGLILIAFGCAAIYHAFRRRPAARLYEAIRFRRDRRGAPDCAGLGDIGRRRGLLGESAPMKKSHLLTAASVALLIFVVLVHRERDEQLAHLLEGHRALQEFCKDGCHVDVPKEGALGFVKDEDWLKIYGQRMCRSSAGKGEAI
jgi:hypothetical protein